VNTLDLFSSQRTVRQKSGKNLGNTASTKWSLGRQQHTVDPSQGHRKPFGSRRSKGKKVSYSGMQSSRVVVNVRKQDEWQAKKQQAQKNKHAATKTRNYRQQTQANQR
jgi:hypothetical protein